MTYRKKLDTTLNLLYDKKGFVESYNLPNELEETIDKSEITLIVNKLLFDNLIEKVIGKVDESKPTNLNPMYACRINYHGLIFKENGGYHNKHKMYIAKKSWTILKIIAASINAIAIISISYLGLKSQLKSNDMGELMNKEIKANLFKIDSLSYELNSIKSYQESYKTNLIENDSLKRK